MDREDQLVDGSIRRDVKMTRVGGPGGSNVGGDHDVAVSVIAAGCPDRVECGLGEFADDLRGFPVVRVIIAPSPFIRVSHETGFVQEFKDELFVVVPEHEGNLFPDAGHEFHRTVGVKFIREVKVLFIIMMNIDDDVEVLIKGIIDHFDYPVHPRFVDGKCAVHMVVPGDGNPHGGNARILEPGHHGLRGNRLTPAGFGGKSGLSGDVGVEGVTEVPSRSKLFNKIDSTQSEIRHFGAFGRFPIRFRRRIR